MAWVACILWWQRELSIVVDIYCYYYLHSQLVHDAELFSTGLPAFLLMTTHACSVLLSSVVLTAMLNFFAQSQYWLFCSSPWAFLFYIINVDCSALSFFIAFVLISPLSLLPSSVFCKALQLQNHCSRGMITPWAGSFFFLSWFSPRTFTINWYSHK